MSTQPRLSLEQQFEMQVFKQQVQQLSKEDAQALLVQLKETMLHQSAAFSHILKDAWGIGQGIATED